MASVPRDTLPSAPGARVPRLVAVCAIAALATVAPAFAGTSVFTPDGAWSWFTTPHVVCSGDTIRAGWVTKTGHIQVGEFGMSTGVAVVHDVCPDFEPDDHDCPSIIRTSDGRSTAFYSHHASGAECPLYRVAVDRGNLAVWSPQRSTCTNVSGFAGTTYTNPHLVPGGVDSIFLFFRGGDWKPCFTTGKYDAELGDWTWTDAKSLIYATVGRPYVRYRSSGDGRIALSFTDGHPRDINNNIYYAEIASDRDGGHAYFRADGTKIKPVGGLPLYVAEADKVFNHAANPFTYGDNSWVWDVAFDASGRPVVAYASFLNNNWHQYHWAVYEDGEWLDRVIVDDAGGSIANLDFGLPEYHYSGGMALDPVDPSIVYVSRENRFGGWDIEQHRTHDDGETWSVLPITTGSYVKNVRPVVPEMRPEFAHVVMWMSGKYEYFANYGTRDWWPDGSDEYNYSTAVMVWTGHDLATELAQLATPVPEQGPSERRTELLQNSPNPFNPRTTLCFELASGSAITLDVVDVSGRLVRRLLEGEHKDPGRHTVDWDGRTSDGDRVASGVYLARLSDGARAVTRSMVLLR